MKSLISSIIFAGLFSVVGFAQSVQPSVKMIYRYVGDSIVIRIAPSDLTTWIALQNNGCVIEKGERKTYRKATLLKLWESEKWKPIVTQGNFQAAIAAQAFFGKSFAPLTGDMDMNQLKNAATEMDMRFMYSLMMADFDIPTANVSGWRWTEKVISKNEVISYKAYIPGIVNADTAVIYLNLSQQSPKLPIPEGIRAVEKEKRVDIQWDILQLTKDYSAWWIEKSKDGNTFQRLNSSPYIVDTRNQEGEIALAVFSDTTLTQNYEGNFYRISGINSFAEIGPTSKVIYAMGRDRTPPPSPEVETPEEIGNNIKVSWKISAKPSDLKGFKVEAAPDNLGAFISISKELIKPETMQFSIPISQLGINKYLRVSAFDTSGNQSVSLTVYALISDTIAPDLPNHFEGKIDTNGVVSLNWSSAKARDLMGYRLFYSNSPDHEFSLLSDQIIRDTVYSHRLTLKTLSTRIYYKIVSVDKRYNHSNPSSILMLMKPDTISPITPVFSNFQVSDSTVVLTFINSSSKDVSLQKLYRKSENSTEWKMIYSWRPDSSIFSYVDREILEDSYYQYTLEAIDSSNNASPKALPIKVKIYRKRSHDIVANFTAIKHGNGVQLKWNKSELKVKEYIIRRKRNDEIQKRLVTVSGMTNTYIDEESLASGSYQYSIRAVFEIGHVSAETLAPQAVIIP
jgi:uncharacterized protein